MPMLEWVAQSAENGSNGHWSFSVKAYGAQCSVDPYNTDAGNGLVAGSTGNCHQHGACDHQRRDHSLLSAARQLQRFLLNGELRLPRTLGAGACSAFGSGTCAVPYSPITSCHFYDMDNEPDIWSGTHRDVHPHRTGYDELANDFETEAANLKTWDPAAVRFGPVFSCWWFYWNGANSARQGQPRRRGLPALVAEPDQLVGSDQRRAHARRLRHPRLSRCQYLGSHHRATAGLAAASLSRLLGSDLCEHSRNDRPRCGPPAWSPTRPSPSAFRA